MHNYVGTHRVFLLVLVLALIAPVAAQQAVEKRSKPTNGKPSPKAMTSADLATAKPGRDPNQPIDEEYTKKIKEYTTETFFLSPLVDYMPASKTVPTPKAVLGDIAGAPGKLPYSKEVHDYMRLLAKSTPRVKVFSIGTTRRRPRDDRGRGRLRSADGAGSTRTRPTSPSSPIRARIKMNDALADEIAQARGAGLLHHRHDSLDRSRRADGADGAGLPARGRREPLHPQHPRARHHADHAGRRSRRPRPHGRRSTTGARSTRTRHAAEPALLGQVRRARQQPRRDGADAEAHRRTCSTPTSAGRRRCCTTCTSRCRSSTTTPSATAPTTRGSIRSSPTSGT